MQRTFHLNLELTISDEGQPPVHNYHLFRKEREPITNAQFLLAKQEARNLVESLEYNEVDQTITSSIAPA